MPSISDLLGLGSNGVIPLPTTLASQKLSGATSMSLTVATGWPTTTPAYGLLYQVDSAGKLVPGTILSWKGIVSGSTVGSLVIRGGTDASYPSGSIVEIALTDAWANDLIAALQAEHGPTGVHHLTASSDWTSPPANVARVPGEMVAYGGAAAPTGWLLCDGSAVSRSTYSALFAALGTTFGVGDGSTTFNLPDLRTRVPAGYKLADANFGTLGGNGGEATHTLTQAEMPNHSHDLGFHSGTSVAGFGLVDGPNNQSSGERISLGTGGGGAHNNLQPYLTVNYIIKT